MDLPKTDVLFYRKLYTHKHTKVQGFKYILVLFSFQGLYYQVGDIVSLIDVDGGTYYAQIRGLLQDQYCEKSAVLTWLIPTKNSPPPDESFDPSTYIIGIYALFLYLLRRAEVV